MLHLPAERLAALADEPPSRAEAEHLARCSACCAERNVFLRLREAASDESTRLAPPLSDWASIAAGLRAEGMLAPQAPGDLAEPADVAPITLRATRRFATSSWARAAAAVMLVAGGAIGGRLSAGQPAFPVGRESVASAARDTISVVIADSLPNFKSATEAMAHLTAAEQHYQYAAAFLGQLDQAGAPSPDSSQVYEARLVALDNVMAATRQALYEAPHDPVINRYYLATLGAREATIRQLNTVLPAGERVSRY